MKLFSSTPTYLFACLVLLTASFSCQNPDQREEAADQEEVTRLSTDSLFNLVQYRTFQYFWEGAEPNSGMARERIHIDGDYPQNDQNVVTSGGSGFGILALIVGMERGFITRSEGLARMEKILNFLETADRFQGAFPHWWYGDTGKVKPFSPKDDGGDMVETSFLLQGLLTFREYMEASQEREANIQARINALWKAVNFDFYRNGQDVIYWHWSPKNGWEMNLPIRGYDECLIVYVLGASSPTFPIPASAYHEGWTREGTITQDPAHEAFGHHLALRHNGNPELGGPLFWAHYSFLGLDPRRLSDRYAASYWEHNVNHTLINRAWCVENPLGYKGYGPQSWGLTSSYSVNGYSGHKPGEKTDKGVISPTAALSSMPYTPEYSQEAMHYWYEALGEKVFGPYGFYDAFSEEHDWFPQRYLAIDQGPIVVMMENHRSGLLWDLFMRAPEVQNGLQTLGFTF
ncbi:MAG: glucoamylase family protein [Nitritalea sp.]